MPHDTGRRAVPLAFRALVFSVLSAFSPSAGAETPTSTAPSIEWSPCADAASAGFDCAQFPVPLDHRRPGAGSITLSVIRHPAESPALRIGTLFFNPGGPGGQGTVDLPAWISLFSPAMRERFDIVSWDPRGIGDSTAVQCFDSEPEEASFFADIPSDAFPVGGAQKRAWIETFKEYGRICLQRNGALLSHTSTADTAQDLDLLRQAAGERTLNYLGVSYGTFLGAVYANLFPANLRAMILDGNLVPSVYTNNGDPRVALSSALRFGSDQGIAESLEAFLDQCGTVGSERCAFSAGDAQGTRAAFDALLQRLTIAPATVNGRTVTYALLLKALEGRLFTTRPQPGGFSGWIGGGALLDAVAKASRSGAASPQEAAPAASPAAQPAGGAETYVSPWQSLTVECGDSPNPRPPARFLALDRRAFSDYGPIGVVDLWADEPCASWPVRAVNQYVGPWNNPTPYPILVIGNTQDPSTPYRNAEGMSRELAKARLLTVNGYGHTALLNPSRCAQRIEDEYLLYLSLPPAATVCEQDKQPFE